ncbi:MAG: hypothetical protein FJZ63_06380 [Chlamydiae bacterium]|nr:hypothetical protein [Chlamydiota bacterium]
MILYKIILISFALFMHFLSRVQASLPEKPIYCQHADNITNKFCADIAKKHKLFYYGGGGEFLTQVDKITLDFISIKDLNITEARSLILDCMEDLLQRINNDTAIRPYLSHHPFTEKGLNLSIGLETKSGEMPPSKKIAHIVATNGFIHYNSYDHRKQTFNTIHKETYQEALKLANISSRNIK